MTNGSPPPFAIERTDGNARAGWIHTRHGPVPTPAFMPVGTRAAVKAMSPAELWAMGYRMVLANAYHIALRPGAELIAALGGIQRFMGWRGAVLTDSGGFQAMSLAALSKLDERGIEFRSHLDGRLLLFTPEESVRVQQTAGADIIMALDECTPYPAEHERAHQSMELTARWAERCLKARQGTESLLFGIVQGGMFGDLRRTSVAQITALGFDGFAVGGLSVGEPQPVMMEMAEISAGRLPPDRPRYLMGVGTPQDLVAAIAMGYDMFDCVLPTRNARNGTVFVREGRLSIKRACHAADDSPLDKECECRTCQSYSRAYLRHLFVSGEILAARALTEHNLYFYARLMSQARAAITECRYASFAKAIGEASETTQSETLG